MTQDLNTIILSNNKENLKREQLLRVLQKKRLLLQELVVKTEILKVNLEMAKQEYMVRVGSLFIKDNRLELEIIRLKNIVHLVQKGYTQDEAEKLIAQKYYAQQEEIEQEQEELLQEEIKCQTHEHNIGLNSKLKKIWKKLIMSFHPDLIQDTQEKQKREEIMKKINLAYQAGDYDQLLKIEKENTVISELTLDNLEELVGNLSEEIRQQKAIYSELKKSEWYGWFIKIERYKKKSINIFADTERRLLNDIVAKIEKVKKLQYQIQNLHLF